jgi:hypothetical protein
MLRAHTSKRRYEVSYGGADSALRSIPPGKAAPDDVYFGRKKEILKKRRNRKHQALARRKAINLGTEADPVT